MFLHFLYSINIGLVILFFFWILILFFIFLRKPNKSKILKKLFFWSFLIFILIFGLISFLIGNDSFL